MADVHRSADWVAHVVQGVEDGDQLVAGAGEVGRADDFEPAFGEAEVASTPTTFPPNEAIWRNSVFEKLKAGRHLAASHTKIAAAN